MRINGINNTVQSVTLIISPAISGALMPIMPIGQILFIDIVTAVIGVGILSLLTYKYKNNKSKEKINYLADIKEGVKYIKSHKFIRKFMLYYVLITVLIAPIAMLTPLMVTRTFGDEEWRLTVNEIAFFVGSIIRRKCYISMGWV